MSKLLYKAQEQSAAGVMTLEPLMNWVGSAREQEHVDAIAYRFKTLQVVIETTAEVELQGSNDGVNWVTLGAALTASGGVSISDYWAHVRVNVTAWTAGAVNATLLLAC